jgi:hypothetical protein
MSQWYSCKEDQPEGIDVSGTQSGHWVLAFILNFCLVLICLTQNAWATMKPSKILYQFFLMFKSNSPCHLLRLSHGEDWSAFWTKECTNTCYITATGLSLLYPTPLCLLPLSWFQVMPRARLERERGLSGVCTWHRHELENTLFLQYVEI